jgi:hypothetical protein
LAIRTMLRTPSHSCDQRFARATGVDAAIVILAFPP